MPHAALCVSRRYTGEQYRNFTLVSMPHAALCVSRPQPILGTRSFPDGVSMPHAALCVSRRRQKYHSNRGGLRFNAARSIVCVETITSLSKTQQLFVSMPHAALCVSRPWQYSCSSLVLLVSMPHAALCVSRPQSRRRTRYQRVVSMPHAALCVSRHKPYLYLVDWRWFQCRTQHCVCRDLESTVMNWQRLSFQCRTQHCVCRDTVSRSPCPARAEKAFWKDALFCAVFGVCG